MKHTLRTCLLFVGLAVVCQAQITRFQHIIVVFQENRTPDNLFYALCASNPCSATPTNTQYNIQTGPWKDGSSASGSYTPVAKPLNNLYDLNHSHTGWLEECDPPHPKQKFACRLPLASALPPSTCLMDGASCTSPHHGAYIYVDNSKGAITPYLTLATSYGWIGYRVRVPWSARTWATSGLINHSGLCAARSCRGKSTNPVQYKRKATSTAILTATGCPSF